MHLLQFLQQALVTQDFGMELGEVQIRTVLSVERQHVTGQLHQATGPSPVVSGGEVARLPVVLDALGTCLHPLTGVVPVTADPASGQSEWRGKDLLLQARPGEAVNRLDAILQCDNLAIQAVELFAGTLAGQRRGR